MLNVAVSSATLNNVSIHDVDKSWTLISPNFYNINWSDIGHVNVYSYFVFTTNSYSWDNNRTHLMVNYDMNYANHITDASTNAYDAVISNNVYYAGTDKGYLFDLYRSGTASDSSIRDGGNITINFATNAIENIGSSSNVTISMWVYPIDLSALVYRLVDYVNNSSPHLYETLSGTYSVGDYTPKSLSFLSNFLSTEGAYTTNNSMNRANQWTHIVSVMESGVTSRVYFDGVEQGYTTNTIPNLFNGNHLSIGRDYVGGYWAYSGYMKNFRTYSYAFTATDATNLYLAGKDDTTTMTDNIRVWFPMLSNEGIGEADQSYYAYTNGIGNYPLFDNQTQFITPNAYTSGISSSVYCWNTTMIVSNSPVQSIVDQGTVSAWVKVAVDSGSRYIMRKRTYPSGNDFEWTFLRNSSGQLSAWVSTPTISAYRQIYIDAPLIVDGWHQLAFTYTNNLDTPADLILYVDGVAQTNAGSTSSGTFTTMTAGPGQLVIGQTSYHYLDKTKIYNQCLTPTDMLNNFLHEADSRQAEPGCPGAYGHPYWYIDNYTGYATNLAFLATFDSDDAGDRSLFSNRHSGTPNGVTHVDYSDTGTYSFDGINDSIDYTDGFSFTNNSWTFGAWINADTVGGAGESPILFGAGSGYSYVNIQPQGSGDGDYVFRFYGNASGHPIIYSSTTNNLTTNTWHQIIVTRANTNYMMYVDGQYASAISDTNAIAGGKVDFSLGYDGFIAAFDGEMDNVFGMNNYAMPLSEVSDMYDADVLQSPVRGSNRSVVPWTPADSANVYAWVDASDNSTITSNATFVSAWDSKIGTASFIQNTGSRQPEIGVSSINGRNVITFSPPNTFLDDVPFDVPTNGNYAIYIVYKYNSSAVTRSSLLSVDGYGYEIQANSTNEFDLQFAFFGNGAATFVSSNPPHNGPSVLGLRFDFPTVISLYIDGSLNSQSASYGVLATGTRTRIGGARAGGASFEGDVAEIVWTDNITDAEGQKIEGYLAWKWGLMGNLPAGHPYKNKRPLK